MTLSDQPVFPKDLMEALRIKHPNTLREQIKAGKVPDFDVKITQKTRYWHRSTLVRHGLLPPASASQTNPEASAAVPA